MKLIKSILYTSAVALLGLTACDKELDIDSLDFDVSTAKTTYKLGDTVVFKFKGNPDNITLFTGEEGHKYEYRERLRAEGKPELSFTSFRQYGTQTLPLELLVSTTFNGKVDKDVANGGWKNITDKATFSTTADNTPSGKIDLSEYVGDKPLYIAFHYKGEAGSTQRKWTIKNFEVSNKLTSGVTLTIADLSNAGFSEYSYSNPNVLWKIEASQISIQGGPATNEANDDWVVTQALYLDKVMPDSGMGLKNITTKMTEYPYVFTKPGTYKVTFIASNATADKSESVVKELEITIEP
ncbi:hypothetical protein BCY91_03830 [Pelobium manganitolerans]|uniref:DUF5017 domain-containing protein n=1 Tax=Pelobium manganitolerans TaxID=1842495 RepID=A0A419S7E5_9SPHI|nr:DUF5017 domain-containing protein [Pelobium manganitolerans]RKD17272.1 hypothetical protein BCY91_03830 [Pelobium manganitolerans]